MMITHDDSHGSAGSIFCTEAFIIFVRCSVNSVASHSPRSQHPACDGILNPCGSPMTLALLLMLCRIQSENECNLQFPQVGSALHIA